ncbi:hypothetical protein IGI04_019392, partial [Brassica rapa subsp. trilocularis]
TTSRKSSRRFPGSLPDDFHFSRLDFLEVVWTSCGSRLDFMEAFCQSLLFIIDLSVLVFNQMVLIFHSFKADDLTFNHLKKQISKSIAKITSALTRRFPGKSSTARQLTAHISLLQEHKISDESDPPRIVSFFDFMNHKKCIIKILGFFSLMWRESERDVFSS